MGDQTQRLLGLDQNLETCKNLLRMKEMILMPKGPQCRYLFVIYGLYLLGLVWCPNPHQQKGSL